jgi:GNAT superfamily N-acetyltransferase
MTGPGPLTRPAGPGDLDALSRVLAEAFHPLPPSRWLIPDDAERAEIFLPYFRLLLDTALASGIVATTPARDAAALWIPSGARPLPDYGDRLAVITGPLLPQFRAFDAAMEKHHPGHVPHDWLAVIGAAPARQGQGAGSALLAARHRDLDRAGRGAYLEAADLRARGLYLRHGYADHGPPIELPGGPLMYPMWRDPRPGAA